MQDNRNNPQPKASPPTQIDKSLEDCIKIFNMTEMNLKYYLFFEKQTFLKA